VLAVTLLGIGAGTWTPRWSLVSGAPDNFRSTRLFHLLSFPAADLQLEFEPPAAYRSILEADAGGAVLELPYNGYLRTPYGYYQRRHRREVYLGVEAGWCTDKDTRELPAAGREGFRLSRFVDPSAGRDLAERSIRFVVFHRDPEAEVPWVRPERRRRDRFDHDRCVAAFAELTGSVPLELDGIAVFDLGRTEHEWPTR
jgi:hypothetical protein